MADNEIALDRQEPAEVVKPAGKPKKEKTKKESDGVTLPVLIEFTVTFSTIFLVVVFFTIVGISLLTGANLLDFVLRTSISLLLIGCLLVIIARQISFGMLNSNTENAEEKSEQKQSDEHQKVEVPGASEAQ